MPETFKRQARARSSRSASLLRCVVAACMLAFATAAPSLAQTGATGSISGHVADSSGVALAGASILLQGPTRANASSDSSGDFTISDLVPGLYRMTVTKGAYVTEERDDITVLSGSPTTVAIQLEPSSFSSLQEIGRVIASGTGAGAINTTPAAVATITASAALDQGLQSLTQVLNQTPGIVTTVPDFGSSSDAYASSVQEPQIRGALPYESLVEIDGHPMVTGSSGVYSLLGLTPYTMQSAELVKGPGAMPDVITGAIGGTLNYRTLEPTTQFNTSVDFVQDFDGSTSSNFKVTGTANGKLGYAFDYGIVGQNSPLQNYSAYTTPFKLFNGGPECGAGGVAGCPSGAGLPAPPGVYAPSWLSVSYPVALCCDILNSPYFDHTDFGKLRYNFSPSTSLTATYLGATSYQVQSSDYAIGNLLFAPPAGYTGSLPVGTQLPESFLGRGSNVPTLRTQQGLFESDFRTAIGQGTFLLRYYSGAEQTLILEPPPTPGAQYNYDAWGGLPIGPGGTTEYFNDTPVTLTGGLGCGIYETEDDHFAGETAEFDIPSGNNLYTASIDRTTRNSYYEYFGTAVVPSGASQAITTGSLRGTFVFDKLTATLGNYFIGYTSHFTPNGGVTWSDASNSLYAPRLAFTYRADPDTSVRLSAGASFAPPYLALINTQGGAPIGNNSGFATSYSETLNNGNISPETSFGEDIGIDQRLSADGQTIVSADAYQTTLHGQFLPSTYLSGTYTATSGANIGRTEPLYVTTTTNLGVSQYNGVELSIRREPDVGFGFVAQGALIRAYAYDISPSFYSTASGPITTNLAILPYVNFTGGGDGYNGIGGVPNVGIDGGNVPYSQGYASISYRWPNKGLALLGATLYGSNNSFNVPAFWEFNGSVRVPVAKNTTLQFSAINIFNVLNSPFTSLLGGQIQTPLANGLVGTTTLGNLGPATYYLTLHWSLR